MRKACILIVAVAASEASLAGGFALIEHGASGLGNSYAGAAAVSDDASTIWFNPAGMSELKQPQLLVAGHVIGVSSDFTDRGTTLNNSFGGGFVNPDFATASTVDASGTSVIPNLYYVHPLKNGVTLGVGFGVPFGNSSDYDPAWVGRYQAIESAVAALDINPSISYLVNENLSIGGGISIQNLSATLGSAYDSSGTCFGLVTQGALPVDTCIQLGLENSGVQALDGLAEVEGDSTALSFNLGLLYKPRVGTKLGIAYRHGIEHELDGTGEFTNNPAFQAIIDGGLPLFVDSPATADASLPPTLMFAGAHEVNDQVELLAAATWTGWSSFDELRIEFEGLQPDTFNTLEFEDVWRVSGGINYKFSDQLTFRGGVAFDQDPVPSPQLRTPRIPTSDRTWLSFGVGYQHNQKVGFDVGFAHLMVDDTPLDNASESPGGTTLRGEFETNVNILSAQVTVQFD